MVNVTFFMAAAPCNCNTGSNPLTALEILLNFLHRGNTQSEQDCFAAAVLDTAASILYKSDDLKKIKYNLLPKPL